ncbi:hypothetical protein QJS04_geneDACA023258 [Acorus gramineus]|uniref:Uncharacterized protein n=1 Tax=Acorus gramineus TaxID=55184 RepID=A0AAV9A570_ACOGR|nr:hypothetical protein QJS04_geneDACA017988 [Acorus gramineus]KAK1259497.1 hypothetical protein QJS04_geneDACA023258 [Acorus gramineus]
MEGMRLKIFVVMVLLATQFFGYSEERDHQRFLLNGQYGSPSEPSVRCLPRSCSCPTCSHGRAVPTEEQVNLHN